MRDGEKVVELSRLQSKNNRILRPLLRFYGLPFDDSSFDHRLKTVLLWLGYPIYQSRLASLEVKLNDICGGTFGLKMELKDLKLKLEMNLETPILKLETILSRIDSLEHSVNANLERDRRTNDFIQSQIQARRNGH